MGAFDEHAEQYDSWFLKNRNVLASEVLLLARLLERPGEILSVGCGSGLFEWKLREDHGINIERGIEPASTMAAVARQRGLEVRVAPAEELPFDAQSFDTLLMNGITPYVRSLPPVFREAHRVLRPGGRLVVADVPASGGYGLLYQLAAALGDWELPALKKVSPADPYPTPFLANWRTTEELTAALGEAGFGELEYAQTLTTHPRFSNDAVEEPIAGYQRGGYVAIRARKL